MYGLETFCLSGLCALARVCVCVCETAGDRAGVM